MTREVTWEPSIKLCRTICNRFKISEISLLNCVKQEVEVWVCFEQTDMEVSGNSAAEILIRWSGTNPVLYQNKTKNKLTVSWFVDFFIYGLWSSLPGGSWHVCFMSTLLVIICRKLGFGTKEQIQTYKNILPNLENNTGVRSHLDVEAVDWVDKYLQIGSAYYFTQSDSEKQIGYRRGFYLQLLRLVAFGDLLQLFKRPEQPPSSYTPLSSPIRLGCD